MEKNYWSLSMAGEILKLKRNLFVRLFMEDGNPKTCTQCGMTTRTYEKYKAGFFRSYIFCCVGCLQNFANNNGMQINRIPRRWTTHRNVNRGSKLR